MPRSRARTSKDHPTDNPPLPEPAVAVAAASRELPALYAAEVVLAVDPGTAKCGVAIARRGQAVALHREVAETERLVARVLSLLAAHPDIGAVLVGNATRGSVLLRALRAALPPGLPVLPVEEAFTSQRARERFRLENPPRGWARLLPPGLRTPPRPYDDYVALLLAEDFFAAGAGEASPSKSVVTD